MIEKKEHNTTHWPGSNPDLSTPSPVFLPIGHYIIHRSPLGSYLILFGFQTRAFNDTKWPPKYKSIFSFWIVCSKWKLQLTVIHVLKCNVHHRDSDLNKANACYYYTKFFHFWPLKLYSNFQVFYIIKIISNYTVPRFIRSWLCYINIKALLLFSSHFQNFQHNSGSGVSKNCLKKVKDHAVAHFEWNHWEEKPTLAFGASVKSGDIESVTY